MEKTQLITVAETLNEILGLDPEIPTKGKKVTVEMLTEKINEAVDLLVEDDKMPEEVREILSEMHPDNDLFAAPEPGSEDEGGENEAEEDEAEADADEEESEAGEDADSSEETDDEATDAVEEPKKGKKGRPKKEKVAKEPKPKKEKVKKEPVVREPSAFGVATNILCKNPDMPYAELKEAVRQELGSDAKMTAMSTAYSSVRKIVRLLRENKLMK